MLYEVDVVVRFQVEEESADQAGRMAVNFLDEAINDVLPREEVDRMMDFNGITSFEFGTNYQSREA